jgi:hypothetical protein
MASSKEIDCRVNGEVIFSHAPSIVSLETECHFAAHHLRIVVRKQPPEGK